ncbi:ribose/xylose/arabinose/galactoside ABC transporter permease [Eggerthella sp. YY7918]|uniref:ribose/xylose/arabinose/galactoside ABC transporter permease n=1 Tax=Eggerthella sp. (strain YY7918) TaxID=502558 RepID=UPI0002170EE8|nr:ribose/xylose/arabinose/galactoside ABC transporter permease [Eggerthella sp. YY7918]BAK43658.1 ribose/xylose/arabinose/galactoside ABC-type transport system, permease component [Eggerthella sp. YY7918]
MFNLLKSDIYRLVHGRMLWVGLALLAAFVAFTVGLVWFATTPVFAQMVNEQAEANMSETPSGGVVKITNGNSAELTHEEAEALNEKVLPSRTNAYAQTLISGGVLALFVSLTIALFLVSDFETGFAKNVFAGRRRRAAYYLEKLMLCGVLTSVFLLAGMVLTDGGFMLAGFEYRFVETVGKYWSWVALAWLAVVTYVVATSVVVLLTRSKAAGIAFAIIIATGMLASLVMTVASALAPAFPVLADAVKWLPTFSVKLLGSGGIGLLSSTEGTALVGMTVLTQIALVAGMVIAACTALALAICPRKDV